MDGVINVNKKAEMTSFDVIAILRKILNMKKIGHTGTLDPDATGVLPVCVGKGTKLVEMLTANDKQYIAGVKLGIVTDTQDLSGNILEKTNPCIDNATLKSTIMSFMGESEQIPPMYSAIQVNGERLYKLAREGKTVEREPRKIFISNIVLNSYNKEENTFYMTVDCSKGTYIRTLANDIGQKLGCGAALSSLERTKSGRFSIDKSFTLDEIRNMAEKNDFSFILNLPDVMSEFEKTILAEQNSKKLIYGVPFNVAGLENGKTYRLFDEKNQFLAIAQKTPERLKILKTFF